MLRVLSLFYCRWIGGSHLKSDNDSAVIRQTKEDKICMFRGYEHVQRAHSLRRKKLPCDPALASAGLCVGVTSDIDTIFGPSEAMLFGSKVCQAPQCVIFQSLMPEYVFYDLECDRNLSK